MSEKGPYVGPQTKPRQEPSSVVTLESVDYTAAKVSGVFAVTVPGAVWRSRPAFGDLETEIANAIRGVLDAHAIQQSEGAAS
jgi:hypothetical protein